MLPEVCGFRGTMVNALFSSEIKSKASEQRGKCFYLPNYLEGKCKCQKPRLPAGGLKGLGTYRVRQQHHDLLGHGRPKTLREKKREQECVSQ